MPATIIRFPAAPAPARPVRAPATRLARLIASLAEADARYREAVYLAEMDDRLLRDIGITRADAEAELRRFGSRDAFSRLVGALLR
jgi:uncharacterized protein YjiS (DUF1127 family)